MRKKTPSVYIEEGVQIIKPRRLRLGENVIICRGAIIECGGRKWCDFKGGVTIGDNVYIAQNALLFGAGEIEIQRGCSIGLSAMILSYTPDVAAIRKDPSLLEQKILPHAFGKITIEEGAFIGPNSIIMKGVTIGRGALVAPGSIVRHNVPPETGVLPNTKLIKRKYIMPR